MCHIFSELLFKPPCHIIHSIISSAVTIEQEFISESLPVELIGMNSTLMCRYIEFCADWLLYTLGVDKLYHSPNPFPWMEPISLPGKTNFHERRVGEYALANVTWKREDRIFDLNANF